MMGNQNLKLHGERLVWDDVSPTIDTRFDTPSNGKNSHPYLNRAITQEKQQEFKVFQILLNF